MKKINLKNSESVPINTRNDRVPLEVITEKEDPKNTDISFSEYLLNKNYGQHIDCRSIMNYFARRGI